MCDIYGGILLTTTSKSTTICYKINDVNSRDEYFNIQLDTYVVLHVDIIMLHVDINESYVNVTLLTWKKYATIDISEK